MKSEFNYGNNKIEFNKINPTMFTAIGIKILNGAATFGGTDPGILIVISFETKR